MNPERSSARARLRDLGLTLPPASNGPWVLFYDIETAPKIGLYWGKEWQTNIAKRVAGTQVLSVAYRWEDQGRKTTGFVGAWESESWESGLIVETDRDLGTIEALWALFDAADVVVAHNGDKFDQLKSQGRFLRHAMTPPSAYVEVDTLKIARTHFGLDSYRLDDLAAYLGLEGKVSHEGIALWEGVLLGDREAQRTMRAYNRRDTELLEEVYSILEPWVGYNGKGRKFNRALWEQAGVLVCPSCGSYDLSPNGFRETMTQRYQSYICGGCGARPSERTISQSKKGVRLK